MRMSKLAGDFAVLAVVVLLAAIAGCLVESRLVTGGASTNAAAVVSGTNAEVSSSAADTSYTADLNGTNDEELVE